MVMCICVRGPTLARLAMVLVLLSIGNTPALRVITLHWEFTCSTSYFARSYSSTSHSSRRKNAFILRIISLQAGRSLLYELLLSERRWHSHSASHHSSQENTPTLRIHCSPKGGRALPLYESSFFEKEEFFHSTSHLSSSFTWR